MGAADLAIGMKVVVHDDPDTAPFRGLVGTIEAVDVECCAGPGVIMRTVEFGLLRASYDMIERVN